MLYTILISYFYPTMLTWHGVVALIFFFTRVDPMATTHCHVYIVG